MSKSNYSASEVCTMREWLDANGLKSLAVDEYTAKDLVVKGDGKPHALSVNDDGTFWHYASGPVLFSVSKVAKSSAPNCHPSCEYFPLRIGFGVVLLTKCGVTTYNGPPKLEVVTLC